MGEFTPLNTMTDFGESPIRPEFLPLSVARALWKRKGWLVSVWLAVGILVTAVALGLPSIYEAETLILIEGQRIPERYVAATVNDELNNRLSVLAQQIESYETLRELIDQFGLYEEESGSLVEEEIIEQMREDIRVELVSGLTRQETEIPAFTISYQGRDAEVVARVANEIRDRFLSQNLKMREDQAVGTSEFLEGQLRGARRALETQESLLSEYRSRYNGQLPEQANSLMAILNRLQLQLEGVQDSVRQTQQSKMMLENALASAEASAMAFSGLASQAAGPGVEFEAKFATPLDLEVDKAESMLVELRSRYRENHPDVRRAVAELERLKQRQAQADTESLSGPGKGGGETAAVAETDASRPNTVLMQTLRQQEERVRNLKLQLALGGEELESLSRSKAAILGEIANVQARVNNLPIREQELAKVIRDYDISKANYQSLLNKRMEADVAAEMETRQKAERFRVLDVARVPEKPIKPERALLIVGGWLGGLLLGCVAGYGVERKSNVLLGEWELPAGTPVLGRVPPIRTASAAPEPMAPQKRAWRKPRLSVRVRSRTELVVAPTLLLCLVGAIVATSVYLGWSPF